MSSSLLHPRRLVPAVAILIACLCASAGSAHAAGCTPTYDVATRILTIDSCWSDPDAPNIAGISRTAAGAIQLNSQSIPGGPTVTNTDKIIYHGEDGNGDQITLDMSNGQFAPGHTPEVNGSKWEIEIEIDGGTGGSDNFLTILGMDGEVGDRLEVGANGIDVDDDGDSDITRTNLGRLTVDAQDGPDHLYGTGFSGYATSTAPLTLRGGAGNDSVKGGAGSDDLSGGPGVDWLTEHTPPTGGLTLTGTSLTGNGTDAIAGFEKGQLYGGSEPETIDASAFTGWVWVNGGSGADHLIGSPHDDTLRGSAGDDTIHGGPGSDLVTDTVQDDVSLTDTSLTSPLTGTDTLDSMERGFLVGVDSDDRIDASGFSGTAELHGGYGNDTLIAAAGGGLLKGYWDDDELVGGVGPDLFQGDMGDDRITSRDELTEQVYCGDGADSVVADVLDGLTGCEQIDRGDSPQAGGGTDGGTGSGAAGQSSPAADVVAPALSGITMSRRSFRAATKGAALVAAAVGTRLRYTLSEGAKVTFRIQRAAGGRYVQLRGKLVHTGAQGANSLVLRGRLGRRALRPGAYRLVARATDGAGNRSAVQRVKFRVLPG